MSDATKTSSVGMRIDTPRPHALHPRDAKRTSQDLCADSLCAGQVIAEAVCARTSSPAVSPVCVAVHALVKTHCIRRPDDIRTHFHTVDAFVEWLRTVEAVSGQFKTLKPAFQKYLCDVHGMVQRKTHRSFLDTRDASEAQKALVDEMNMVVMCAQALLYTLVCIQPEQTVYKDNDKGIPTWEYVKDKTIEVCLVPIKGSRPISI